MGEQDQAAVGRLWRPRRRRIAEHGFYDQRAGASIARSKSSSSPGGGLHAWRTWVAAPEGAGGLSGVDGCQPRWRVRPFPGDRGIAFRAAGPALSSWRRSWPCALAVICRLGAAATFRQCQPSQRDLTGAGAARLVACCPPARPAGAIRPCQEGRRPSPPSHRRSRSGHGRVDTHGDVQVAYATDQLGRHLARTQIATTPRAIGRCWTGPRTRPGGSVRGGRDRLPWGRAGSLPGRPGPGGG